MWLFPQGGSERKEKQPSLRPETSTYKLWAYRDSSSSESIPQRISQSVWDSWDQHLYFSCKMSKSTLEDLHSNLQYIHPESCQTKKILLLLLKQEDFQSSNNCSKAVNQSSWSFSGAIKIKPKIKESSIERN